MKKNLIPVVLIIIIVISLLVYIAVGTGDKSSSSDKTAFEGKNNPVSGDKKNRRRIKSTEKKITSKKPAFAGNNTEIEKGAKEIILNSADEPRKIEAPEIKLDENDNPIVDAEGMPVGIH